MAGIPLDIGNHDYVGFFGQVNVAEIKNLNIKGEFISGRNYVGFLIGEAKGKVTIHNVHRYDLNLSGMKIFFNIQK